MNNTRYLVPFKFIYMQPAETKQYINSHHDTVFQLITNTWKRSNFSSTTTGKKFDFIEWNNKYVIFYVNQYTFMDSFCIKICL